MIKINKLNIISHKYGAQQQSFNIEMYLNYNNVQNNKYFMNYYMNEIIIND